MDLSAIVTGVAVLEDVSIRGASRRLGKPVASVHAALDRLEKGLATDLVFRTGNSITLTLDAERFLTPLMRIRQLCELLWTPAAGRKHDDCGRAVDCALSLKVLQRFNETIRAGSIRGSARRLGIGQPQLSRQLQRMEKELGAALFHRDAGGISLTDDGKRVQEAAISIMAIWNDLVSPASSNFSRTNRTIHIGSVVPSGHESQVARLLATLFARWEGVRRRHHLSLKSTLAEELVSELKAGRLDLAILDTEAGPLGLDGLSLSRSRLALIGYPGLDTSRSPDVIMREEKVAVPSRRSGLRQAVSDLMKQANGGAEGTPDNFVEIDSIPVIVNLVIHHRFVTVLPLTSVAGLESGLTVIELSPHLDLPLWLVWPRARALGRVLDDILDCLAGFETVPSLPSDPGLRRIQTSL